MSVFGRYKIEGLILLLIAIIVGVQINLNITSIVWFCTSCLKWSLELLTRMENLYIAIIGPLLR